MKSRTHHPHRLAAAAFLGVVVLGAGRLAAVEIFDYCLENRDQCALSVHHLTEGWERHLNADRLQVTASTFKVLTLVVYAQAVVDGRLDPDREIAKEEWARFWVGRDGGALARGWESLGRPDRVTLDQMMRLMIEESDNASPDWLLAELGSSYFRQVLGRYVEGYHDTPLAISAAFLSLAGNPDDPAVGRRMLERYSGVDALGFRKEASALFRRLADADLVAAARRASCQFAPWETPAPGCVPQREFLDVEEARELLGSFFVQSNTRTYNRLLHGILEETLLPAAVQEIVVRHLEFALEDPQVAALATRLGQKGGSLAPQNICNLVSYAELRATGERVVASIFLNDVPTDLGCGEDLRVFELLESVLLEPAFRQELRDRVPAPSADESRPELLARIETLKHKSRASGDRLKTRLRVRNIGVGAAEGPFEVWLVASDDPRVDRRDKRLETWVLPGLGAGQERVLRFKGKRLESLAGRYLFVRVDPKKEVAETDESSNRPWELLP